MNWREEELKKNTKLKKTFDNQDDLTWRRRVEDEPYPDWKERGGRGGRGTKIKTTSNLSLSSPFTCITVSMTSTTLMTASTIPRFSHGANGRATCENRSNGDEDRINCYFMMINIIINHLTSKHVLNEDDSWTLTFLSPPLPWTQKGMWPDWVRPALPWPHVGECDQPTCQTTNWADATHQIWNHVTQHRKYYSQTLTRTI